MSRVVKIIKNASVKFGPLPVAPAVDIDPALLTDYGCQVTEARVTASANTTDIDATFCEPASSINVPSSFTLELNGLQDWGTADGFSEYSFINDAEQVAFALFLEAEDDPSATGICSMAAGDFGGVAGEPLTFSASLPILGKPTITGADGTPLAMSAGAQAARASAPEETQPSEVNA